MEQAQQGKWTRLDDSLFDAKTIYPAEKYDALRKRFPELDVPLPKVIYLSQVKEFT